VQTVGVIFHSGKKESNFTGEEYMNIAQVREKAKALGVKTASIKKADLIRQIQVKEGFFPCFGTAKDYCDQLECAFREDCLG